MDMIWTVSNLCCYTALSVLCCRDLDHPKKLRITCSSQEFYGFQHSTGLAYFWQQSSAVFSYLELVFSSPGVVEHVLTSRASCQGKKFQFDPQRHGTITIEFRSSMTFWFMCHTWGPAHSPAELQGGQGQNIKGYLCRSLTSSWAWTW